MMDLQICVPPPPPPPATPPRARHFGAPPPPPTTPPPPNLAQRELLATQDHLGQPSSKTDFTSSNLSTEINDRHDSVEIGFPSLAEHPPCSMPSSSNEAGRGRSSMHELNPWRLQNPWRDTGNIDGSDGYTSSELSSEDDESTDHSGTTDGANEYPSYDAQSDLWEYRG